jgi:hypothetical protein
MKEKDPFVFALQKYLEEAQRMEAEKMKDVRATAGRMEEPSYFEDSSEIVGTSSANNGGPSV